MGLSRKPLKLPRHELALLPLLLLELKAATSRTVRTIHIYNRRKSADPAPASEQPPAPLHLCGQKIIASHRIALQNKIASHCQYGLGFNVCVCWISLAGRGAVLCCAVLYGRRVGHFWV